MGLALVVALGVGFLLGGLAAWPLGSFLATVVYLGFVALEMGVAEKLTPTIPERKEESS